MTREEYLADNEVQAFAAWLGANLDNSTFAHQYLFRKSNKQWSCTSLGDAFVNYQWTYPAISRLNIESGSSFESNARALATLRCALQEGLEHTEADLRVRDAASDVMRWGGVTPGNVQWLHKNSDGLAREVARVRDAIRDGDTSAPALRSKLLRFNAGMTKVYSLICDDFVIYDSRVAAALGWAVLRFCKATGRATVPSLLQFPFAPAKEALNQITPKRRDPSQGAFQFPRLYRGRHHAEWNLKASWALKAALACAPEKSLFRAGAQSGQALRAMEASLFMFGYDLPPGP
jgi:hypothetical protein